MTRFDHWAIFAIPFAFIAFAVISEPHLLSDENSFLKSFVGQDLLSLIGVLVSVSLASTANVHIQLKKLEDKHGEDTFKGTKAAVKKSANSLIYCLLLSLALVVVKPMLPVHETLIAAINSLALAILVWGVMVMLDMTRLALKL